MRKRAYTLSFIALALSLSLAQPAWTATRNAEEATTSQESSTSRDLMIHEDIPEEEASRLNEVYDSQLEYQQRLDEAPYPEVEEVDPNDLKLKPKFQLGEFKDLNKFFEINWWKNWRANGGGQPFDWQGQCGQNLGPGGEVLECWLAQHPQVANQIVWEVVDPNTGQVTPVAFANWSSELKQQLYQAFYQAHEWMKHDLGIWPGSYTTSITDPPGNLLTLSDEGYPCNRITTNAARKIYIATVGHSLALEIGGFVPWSVTWYTQTDMQTLFHSKYFYQAGEISCDKGTHQFNGYSIRGRLIPSAPHVIFEHLIDKNLIGPDHMNTITRMLNWSRDHMSHYLGGYNTKNVEDYWHYRGGIPTKRVFEGTYSDSPELYGDLQSKQHWTAGCRGTSEFYRSALRQANIPVQVFRESCEGHTLPIFWTIQRALSHGDDPYSSMAKGLDGHPHPYSTENLLMTKLTFEFWFTGSEAECGNVGRMVAHLALQYLPDQLLKYYCWDKKDYKSHVDGKVFGYLGNYYSLSYLENQQNLWPRLETKAAEQGYCEPSVLKQYLPISEALKNLFQQ